METDISKNVKWRLKRVNKFWFLDIGGKLKWLNMLNKASEVFMEENIIFADDIMYQVSEESDGEVIITEVKSINQKNETSEFKQDDTAFQTETDIKPETRETKIKDLEDIQGMPLEDRLVKKEGEDNSSDNEEMVNYDIGSEEYVEREGKIRAFNKRMKQVIKKKSVKKEVGEPVYDFVPNAFKEDSCDSISDEDVEDVQEDYDCYKSFQEDVCTDDGLVKNEGEDNSSDNKEMVNNDNGSEEYVKRKGRIRGFFKRMKQIIKKKPTETKYGDPVYDFVHNAFEEGSCASISDEDAENEDVRIDGEDYELSFDPGDIITNINPVDEGLRLETTVNEVDGKFPAKYVKVCEKSNSKVTELWI